LRGSEGRGGKAPQTTSYDDLVRLAAGLERLPAQRKAGLGERLLGARRRPTDATQRWWALGRLGARIPFYGSIQDVVRPEIAQSWIEQLLKLDWRSVEPAAFAATQMARLSGDRARDLDPAVRQRVVERLRGEKAPQKWIRMLQEVAELDSSDESLVFGESLPPGLRLLE